MSGVENGLRAKTALKSRVYMKLKPEKAGSGALPESQALKDNIFEEAT